MVMSMTGFGRAQKDFQGYRISTEIRSVNNRYLDLNIRMSRVLIPFEGRIRSLLREQILRGKVEVRIGYESTGDPEAALRYRPELAQAYYEHLCLIREFPGIKNDIRPIDVARMPEVFSLMEEESDESLGEDLTEVVQEALSAFLTSRREEGAHLAQDIRGKVDRLDELALVVEEREPQILAEYRDRLTEKVAQLLEGVTIDENRLATEIVFYADKISTDEEVTRLRSHIRAMRSELESGGGIGRKLDFLAQELNREANTILSKANDTETSMTGIELKTEIEKIREQIQNIE